MDRCELCAQPSCRGRSASCLSFPELEGYRGLDWFSDQSNDMVEEDVPGKALLMIARLAALIATVLVMPSALQAQSPIPQPVIEQCNATARVSELPDCLKNGAIGFEMLELMRSDDFYGPAAKPVIDACTARNETFATTWLCFRRAAADASETGSLIGRDNIADRCIAGLADPALEARISDLYRAKREERFPDKMYFGGEMFYPFQGCPEPSAEDNATDAPSEQQPGGTAGADLDAVACAALGEVEGLVEVSSADELRAFGADLRAMDEPDPSQFAQAFGFSTETAEYLLAGGEERGMIIVTTLGAFIDEHHPGLLMEFFQQHEAPVSNVSGQMGSEIAQGFLTMIIDAARERYQANCRG